MVFDRIERFGNHEKVLFFQDSSVNLKGIIAFHSTQLGPGLGGCRMWNYSSDEAALEDVLKLSRGMTYKAAIADLPLGGAKSVIIGDSKDKTPEMLYSYGKFINSLNGQYIVAEDVGTCVEDMQYIRKETEYVVGLSRELGGLGDPSPFTAQSTLVGMKAAVKYKLKVSSLKGLHVLIQGMGHVGVCLAKLLLEEECTLSITDINSQKIKDFQKKHPTVTVVSEKDVYDQECDVFSPCALGSILNPQTVKRLKCKIVAGAANNQLDTVITEKIMRDKGILYAPDFVMNAGGLISVCCAALGSLSEKQVSEKIVSVYGVLIKIFELSDKYNKLSSNVAIDLANRRIAESNKTHQHSGDQ